MRKVGVVSIVVLALAVLLTLTGCTDRFQPKAPRALFAVKPAEGIAPLVVTFDGSLSFAENGKIKEYVWDLGDGSQSVGPIVSHTYTRGGTYRVTLEVFGTDGRSARRTTEVVVRHPNPTASFTFSPGRPATGERVHFDGTASESPNGKIVDYRWSFGDGNWSGEGSKVQHMYWAGRTYTVTLTVTDEADQKDSITKTVEIVGGTPCQGA